MITIVLAGLLLFLPGSLIALSAGVRGWPVVGVSPALSLGFYAFAGTALGQTGIPWGPVQLAVSLVVVCGIVAAVSAGGRRVCGLGADSSALRQSALGVWWVALAGVGAYVVHRGTGGLVVPQQYWDGMFHANGVRRIAETRDSDPQALAVLAQPENDNFFYPNVFHEVGALLVQMAGVEVPVAVNSVLAVLPAMFAAGSALLAWCLFHRLLPALAAAAVATGLTAFPYDLLFWGPLWPFALSLAAMPAAVAAMVVFVRERSPGSLAVAVLGLVGLLYAQPQVAVAAVLMAMVLVVAELPRLWRELAVPAARWRAAATVLLAVVIAGLAALPIAAGVLGQDSDFSTVDWPAVLPPGAALGQLLTFNQEAAQPQIWAAALVVAGVWYAAAHRRGRSVVVVLAVFLALYVMAAGYDAPLTQQITSYWWNDRWRFAALYTVPAVLLAGLGVQWLADRTTALGRMSSRRASPRLRALVPAVSIGLVLAALVVLVNWNYLGRNTDRVALGYTDGPTYSEAEAEGYAMLAELHDGGAIMNDPNDGSAWAFAYHELPLLFLSPLTSPYTEADIGAERLLLLSEFDQLGRDDEVDRAVEELDVRWVVVSEGFTALWQERAPGLENLDEVPDLELVHTDEAISIYRVRQ